MESDPIEIAIVLGSSSALVTVFAGLARLASLHWRDPTTRPITKTLRQLADPWDGVPNSKARQVINEELNKQRLVQFRVAANVLSVLALPVTGRNIFHDPSYGTVQRVACVLVQSVFALTLVAPHTVTSKSMDVISVGVFLTMSVGLSPFSVYESNVQIHVASATVAALTLNFITWSISWPVLLANAVFAISSCSSLYIHGRCSHEWSCHATAVSQFLMLTMSLGISYLMGRSVRKMVYQSLQLQEEQEFHSAACAILRSCFEVVVEINEEGCVKGHGEELRCFLLHEASHCPEGWRLVDLMVEESEREVFLERLRKPRGEQVGLAENMLVTVRDASNTALRLELLWFQFSRTLEQRYMIGMREFSDWTTFKHRRQEALIQSYETQETYERTDIYPALDRAASPAGETMTLSTSSLPEEESVYSSLDASLAAILVDATREDLPIRSLTCEFCMRVGRLPVGKGLTEYLCRPHGFAQWVQSAVGDVVNDLEPPGSCLVTFEMPQGKVRAFCNVMVGMDTTLDRVGLIFERIRTRTPSTDGCHAPRLGRGTPSCSWQSDTQLSL